MELRINYIAGRPTAENVPQRYSKNELDGIDRHLNVIRDVFLRGNEASGAAGDGNRQVHLLRLEKDMQESI
jgi:hypothetical protein